MTCHHTQHIIALAVENKWRRYAVTNGSKNCKSIGTLLVIWLNQLRSHLKIEPCSKLTVSKQELRQVNGKSKPGTDLIHNNDVCAPTIQIDIRAMALDYAESYSFRFVTEVYDKGLMIC
eukprot:265301_1